MPRESSVTRYGANASGGAHRGVTVDGVHVLVKCHSADEQDATDSVARRIEALGSLEESLGSARRERDKLRRQVDVLNGASRAPSLFGEAWVRVDGQGAVWLLGKREKGWAAFGLRFDSWEELARERPEIRPCGVGSDEHGSYVVVRCMTSGDTRDARVVVRPPDLPEPPPAELWSGG